MSVGTDVLEEVSGLSERTFDLAFTRVFSSEFARVFAVIARVSGDPELANDLAQEAFLRLYRRGSLPDEPPAWLAAVALNLFRNVRSGRSRRSRLLTIPRGAGAHSDPAPSPAEELEAREARSRVRRALDELPERERHLLLLRSEGYSYREIADVLELNEASVGTLLARAKRAFRATYQEAAHAH